MIYARQNGTSLIVAAADDLVELEVFYAKVIGSKTHLYTSEMQPAVMDMMTEPLYDGLTKAPYVFEFANTDDLETFCKEHDIERIKPNRLTSLHQAMLSAMQADPYAQHEIGESHKSIGELHGLDQNDPWDNRSEDEKAEDEMYKKAYEEAKKKGELSDDSWGGGASPSGAKVTDIRTSIDQDGNVRIDNVLAVKGLHDDRLKEMAEADRRGIQTNTQLPIDVDGALNDEHGVLFKVDVTGKSVQDSRKYLMALNFPVSQAVKVEDSETGCWYGFEREALAQQAADIFKKAGITTEVYGCDSHGERLVPKGVEVVDTKADQEEPPRPWNARAGELATMTVEELEANHKGYKGREFVFCGSYEGPEHGCIVYIAPLSWFNDKGTMWTDDLNIAHILPEHLKPVDGVIGAYRSRSTDWNGLTFELANRRGFQENMWLQLYLNSI